jgi:RsiW-degrading membrane proteinase PrsW (M82 family)
VLFSLALYLMLGITALAIGLAAVRYGLYVREPWYLVLLAVVLGAAGMWVAHRAEIWVIDAVIASDHVVTGPLLAAMAAVLEESTKLAGVCAMALAGRRVFRDPLDGLVYGSFTGLGAAIHESITLMPALPQSGWLPAAEPVRLAGHLIMGGIGGFGMAYLVPRTRRALTAIPASFAVAVALHTAWDITAFAASEQPIGAPRRLTWYTVLPVVLMLAGMVLYRRFAAVGARLSRARLQACDLQTHHCPPY